MKRVLILSSLIVGASFASAQSFYEGFENGPAGWGTTNNAFGNAGVEAMAFGSGTWFADNSSVPVGLTGWFSNRTIWTPKAELDQLCANFNCVGGENNHNAFFMSPVRTFNNGDKIRFWTRTIGGSPFPDSARLLLSTSGASTNNADFTTVLADINPGVTLGGYPESYTAIEVTLSGLGGPTSGRFAFHYNTPLGGPLGNNGNFISIDSVNYGVNGVYATEPAGPPPPTAPSAIDLGVISASNSTLVTPIAPLAAAEIRWYKFTLPANVAAATPNFLEIWTTQSGANAEDTELGLYRTDGTLVAANDDFTGLFSNLSFGSGAFPGGGAGASGANINAGLYYLAVGEFNSTYAEGFNAVSTTTAPSFAFNLNLATSVVAAATVNLTGTLNLNDTSGTFAFNRSISYAVKQGTTTVSSGTLVRNTSSGSFSIAVPASATGAATIEWDGSSFLLRKTNVTLNGSGIAVGSVSVQNGDVDNSGEVDAADIDEVIADFGDTSNNTSDVDVSGEVDAADIDIVIANFGGVND